MRKSLPHSTCTNERFRPERYGNCPPKGTRGACHGRASAEHNDGRLGHS